ncbi:hypothetical protein CL632_03355 [bacterium]|jgi:cytoskeletal protein CcmA (bactofilin family)|nr:hypothetical protein [bacterium]MDP6571523.1 hypothetical protein [Patescibacteria group bacterium]MDP6756519.1 hypothetical protein [Patescibacteria group bacterium]|tara:strand:+ start:3864 stop:4865 length:1002 start_codon:yes stop_codon:yes gene_type:complete
MKTASIFLLAFIIIGAPALLTAQEPELISETSKVVDYFNIAAEVHPPKEGARDVMAFGGIVDINNPVTQDVLAAGGTVLIQDSVGGDVRALANKIIIDAPVEGNVAVVGNNIEITPKANISGLLWVRGDNVVMNGNIAGDANIKAKSFEQNGIISGELIHEEISSSQAPTNAFAWFFSLTSFFGMLVVGLVLVSIWPKTVRRAITQSIKNPTHDILWGLGILVATPIAIIVLMFTIIGIPLAFILGAGLLVSLYLAKIMVGIILGTYIFGAIRGREIASKYSLLATMVLGVIVLWLVTGIPGIGWILKLLAMIWGLGLLVNLKLNTIKKVESK